MLVTVQAEAENRCILAVAKVSLRELAVVDTLLLSFISAPLLLGAAKF